MLLGDKLLFKYQFSHRRQAVTQVGNSDLQTRNPVIARPALLDAFATLNAIIHQRRTDNIVGVLFQYRIHYALYLDRFAGVVTNLRIPLRHHLREIAKVALRQTLLLRQEYLPGCCILALLQRRQHHSGKVNETHAGAAVTPLAANRRFNTTNCCVIIGILWLDTQFDKFGYNNFVVVKCWHTKTAANNLHAGIQKIITDTGVIAHTEVGLG
ncbi:Uncharacterised protein [Yersinia enterocolitica]|nr:Uncharacterised protein [Yersinia enterocolitica]